VRHARVDLRTSCQQGEAGWSLLVLRVSWEDAWSDRRRCGSCRLSMLVGICHLFRHCESTAGRARCQPWKASARIRPPSRNSSRNLRQPDPHACILQPVALAEPVRISRAGYRRQPPISSLCGPRAAPFNAVGEHLACDQRRPRRHFLGAIPFPIRGDWHPGHHGRSGLGDSGAERELLSGRGEPPPPAWRSPGAGGHPRVRRSAWSYQNWD
jgi:hypothetical protein